MNLDNTLRVSFTNAILDDEIENYFVNSTVFYLRERTIILPPSEIELDGVSYTNICEVNDLFLIDGTDYQDETTIDNSALYTPFNIWSIWLCYIGFCNEDIWGGLGSD